MQFLGLKKITIIILVRNFLNLTFISVFSEVAETSKDEGKKTSAKDKIKKKLSMRSLNFLRKKPKNKEDADASKNEDADKTVEEEKAEDEQPKEDKPSEEAKTEEPKEEAKVEETKTEEPETKEEAKDTTAATEEKTEEPVTTNEPASESTEDSPPAEAEKKEEQLLGVVLFLYLNQFQNMINESALEES